MGRLFVVGSLNIDSVIAVQRHPSLGETVLGGDPQIFWGGKGANQAVGAVRAGDAGHSDARIVLIGRVGDDQSGRDYRQRLAGFGIDVAQLLVTPEVSTGAAVIAVSETGENSIIVSPGANAHLRPADLAALNNLRAEDVVVLALEVPLSVVRHVADCAAAAGARLVLNLSPVADVPADIVRQADPLIVNEHEALEVAKRYGDAPSILVTRGAAGSNWNGIHVPARTGLSVVDTTGAGDAFCGALSASLASGADPVAAMSVATGVAADAVTRVGAQ